MNSLSPLCGAAQRRTKLIKNVLHNSSETDDNEDYSRSPVQLNGDTAVNTFSRRSLTVLFRSDLLNSPLCSPNVDANCPIPALQPPLCRHPLPDRPASLLKNVSPPPRRPPTSYPPCLASSTAASTVPDSQSARSACVWRVKKRTCVWSGVRRPPGRGGRENGAYMLAGARVSVWSRHKGVIRHLVQ